MSGKRSILLIVGVIALLYLPFLGNAFVSDDIGGIVELMPNASWMTAVGWPRIFHVGVLFQYWAYHLFGLVPWPYRLVNILFHIGTVTLVYLIGKKLHTRTVGLVAALLFAIHPLAIESVTWISGGVYAQYTFWFLVSFWVYLSKKKWSVIGALFFLILSLLTSEKAVILVFLFAGYEWFFGDLRKNWKRLIPFFAVSSILILFYGLRIGDRVHDLIVYTNQSYTGLLNPLLQIPVALSSYLQLFVWPVNLTLYHSELRFSVWDFGVRAGLTMLYLAVCVYTVVKKKPIGFWLVWFVVGLLPTLTPFKIAWIVAERYVYPSLIGLCVAIAMGFFALLTNKRWHIPVYCVGILVLFALGTQTMMRNSEWRTEDTLWIATARTSPSSPNTWNNMGDVYARHKEYDKSIAAFTRAITINPNYADAYHNMGDTYMQMERYDEAIPLFEKAIAINPNLWQSYQNLAYIAVIKGDTPKAIGYLDTAIAIAPTNIDLNNMRERLQK